MALVNFGFNPRHEESNDGRVPPGQSVVKTWPVLTYGPTPHIDTATWQLEIDGAVAKSVAFDWETFNTLPQTAVETDIHCVTRWSRLGMKWGGVSVDELIRQAGGLTDEANYVIVSCYGDYTTNLPVKDVIEGQALVATRTDSEPLSSEHGGPARFFVPHLYFWKSAKYINKITFVNKDRPGFWEQYGYHNHGDPWKEQRYDTDA